MTVFPSHVQCRWFPGTMGFFRVGGGMLEQSERVTAKSYNDFKVLTLHQPSRAAQRWKRVLGTMSTHRRRRDHDPTGGKPSCGPPENDPLKCEQPTSPITYLGSEQPRTITHASCPTKPGIGRGNQLLRLNAGRWVTKVRVVAGQVHVIRATIYQERRPVREREGGFRNPWLELCLHQDPA